MKLIKKEVKKLSFSISYFHNPIKTYILNSFCLYFINFSNFWERLIHKKKIQHYTKSVKFKKGGIFNTFDYGGVFGLVRIWGEGEYGIKPKDIANMNVIVDVGAHIGLFSVFAGLLNKNANIFSYEIDTNNYKHLVENINNSSLNNVRPFNLGVFNKDCIIDYYSGFDSSEYSIIEHFPQNILDTIPNKVAKCNTTTLYNIMKENNIEKIDFLKLDCEGAEFPIIFSLKKDILKKIERIGMEYHQYHDYSIQELGKYLKEVGEYNISIFPHTLNTGILLCSKIENI